MSLDESGAIAVTTAAAMRARTHYRCALTAYACGYAGDTIRQKFTGHERDNESGLDFAQARYYASRFGRFTSTDPLTASGRSAMPQSWNRYAYVLNNPLVFDDATGLSEQNIGRSNIDHPSQTYVTYQPTQNDTLSIDAVPKGQDAGGDWKVRITFTVARPDGKQRGDVVATSNVYREGDMGGGSGMRRFGPTDLTIPEEHTGSEPLTGFVHLVIGEYSPLTPPDPDNPPNPADVDTPVALESTQLDVYFQVQITGNTASVLPGYPNDVPAPRELMSVPVPEPKSDTLPPRQE